ncbi:MAG: LCP family protein [Lachnospiraceae bacterium]|nr:LCP family protein [Lachnospiraceae bacterium]
MEHNNTGDDLIEIIPDVVPEDDHDIKISGSEAGHGISENAGRETEPGIFGNSGAEGNPGISESAGREENPGISESSDREDNSGVSERFGNTGGSGNNGQTAVLSGADESAGHEAAVSGADESAGHEAAVSGADESAGHEAALSGADESTGENTVPDFASTATIPDENDDEIKIAGPIAHFNRQENENDDFSEELEEIELEQQDYKIMEEIGDAIINQVEIESWDQIPDRAELEDDTYGDDKNGPELENESAEEDDEPGDLKSALIGFFTKLPKWGYVVIGSVLVIAIFMLWLTMSAAGQGILVRIGSRYIANKVTYRPVVSVEEIEYIPDDDLEYGREGAEVTQIPEIPDTYEVVTPDITPEPTPVIEQKNVYNVLIIGEENIDSGSPRGRSDLLMIASVNIEQKKVKLTSILRDSLVAIPNHSDNKINAAYMIGGVSLLYETMKVNLGMEFDNYCLVNFDSFEKIVDVIGGVDIELTAEEAAYLNKTNYISKPEFRNVQEGINHLNGNQALGYCRIRKVPTADLQYMDIGRTARQRRLIREIFDNVSRMNNVEMMGFVNKCMPFLTTDITSEQLELFIPMLSSISPALFEELRLPVEGSYHDARLRGMLVTQIDLTTNTEALHTFIYGN